MSDRELMILSTLEDIRFSIELIIKRFEKIDSSDDFLADENGIEKLDGISMRLVAIGEGFKNIDKLTDKKLLPNYPKVNLSHHYFDLDAETIFVICDSYLEELLIATNKMIDDVKIGVENG